ncbi:hypothetical protein OKA05_07055 [Luteolibacter arcticus]|uniref:N-acetyltransferase domain-containing protein n=1 Tax=Luteolibacter arcticus TaxID=1581411 RepID=A0ABT3GFC2_9BACT|nr:hypothetical protein [Luteolibacter arcticus]MCW1922306.1 hypothetical protein [Luteolibacter arcticus]
MAGLIVRPAGAEDHAALEALFRATTMGSQIHLAVERDPDYFAGAAVQAAEPCVWAAFETSGRAVGLLSAGKRRVWLDGERDVRYLCDLRIHGDWQRSTLLSRGYRLLNREVFAPGEWAQTLVLEDNLKAIELLTSRRAGLPEYRPAGIYRTWLLPPQDVSFDPGISVRRAVAADLTEMQRVYNEAMQRRSFGEMVRFADFGEGRWNGLHAGDFLIAERQGRVIGMLGLWDQTAFQRLRIAGYSRGVAMLRPLWNVRAALRGDVPLPPPGAVVPVRKVTALACENDNPAILRALLAEALRTRDEKLTLVGMSAADPLVEAMQDLRGRRDRGHHFLVGWEGGPPAWREPFVFDVARI